MNDADPLEALVSAHVRSKAGATRGIGFAALEALASEAGGLPKSHYARYLIAHLSSMNDRVLASECAGAIATSEDWESHLVDLLTHAPLTSSALAIVADVLKTKAPAHPLVPAMRDMVTVVPAMDMRDDGECMMLRVEGAFADGVGLLLELENPVGHCTAVTLEVSEDDMLCIRPTSSDEWLQRKRSACPAAVLVCRK